MKKALLITCGMSVLTLCACNSGGGKGGVTTVAGDAYIFASVDAVPADGTNIVPASTALWGNTYGIKKTVDGLELTMQDNTLGKTRTVKMSNGHSDASNFRDHGRYIVAEKTTDGGLLSNVTVAGLGVLNGSIRYEDEVYLGGKKLGLAYADFGIWQTEVDFRGTRDGHGYAEDWDLKAVPFITGDAAHKQAFAAGTGTQVFTGRAIGTAYDDNNAVFDDRVDDISGTARMTVDLSQLNASQLELMFHEFYNFTFSNLDVSSGTVNLNGNHTVNVTSNGVNDTHVVLPTGDHIYDTNLKAQFYGPAAHDPTEAVGTFHLDNGSGKGIVGSFGVKK